MQIYVKSGICLIVVAVVIIRAMMMTSRGDAEYQEDYTPDAIEFDRRLSHYLVQYQCDH